MFICDNANMWHSNIPRNQLLKEDKFHLSVKGTSILAANMKHMLHSSLGIKVQNQPQQQIINGQDVRRGGYQNYNRRPMNYGGNRRRR